MVISKIISVAKYQEVPTISLSLFPKHPNLRFHLGWLLTTLLF